MLLFNGTKAQICPNFKNKVETNFISGLQKPKFSNWTAAFRIKILTTNICMKSINLSAKFDIPV